MTNSAFITLTFILSATQLSGCSQPREHIDVGVNISIPANTSITVKSPELLHTPNYWNSLCLLPTKAEQISRTGKFLFLAENGTEFVPKVTLKNITGGEDVFPVVGQLGNSDGIWLCFEPEAKNIRLKSPYTFVVIKSPEPIVLKSIKWHSSDK